MTDRSSIRAIANVLMKHRSTQARTWSRETAESADRHGILVLTADMSGLAGMRPDGELVELGWDDTAAKPITSRRWHDLVLLSGRRFYPELEPLLPTRHSSDLDCDSCGGIGRYSKANSKRRLLVRRSWLDSQLLGEVIGQYPANSSTCPV
jgi:hypothetical protein